MEIESFGPKEKYGGATAGVTLVERDRRVMNRERLD
jgi:hypothetical protein